GCAAEMATAIAIDPTAERATPSIRAISMPMPRNRKGLLLLFLFFRAGRLIKDKVDFFDFRFRQFHLHRFRLVPVPGGSEREVLIREQLLGLPTAVVELLKVNVSLDAVDEGRSFLFVAATGLIEDLDLEVFQAMAVLVLGVHDDNGSCVANDFNLDVVVD